MQFRRPNFGKRLDSDEVCWVAKSPGLSRNTQLFLEDWWENGQAYENFASFLFGNFYFISELRWESFEQCGFYMSKPTEVAEGEGYNQER